MKFRQTLQKSSNARMTCGRLQLRSSAASAALPTMRITVSVGPSSSLEEALQAELQATAHKFITSRANAPLTPKERATLWFAESQSSQDLDAGLLMFSKECSGPH